MKRGRILAPRFAQYLRLVALSPMRVASFPSSPHMHRGSLSPRRAIPRGRAGEGLCASSIELVLAKVSVRTRSSDGQRVAKVLSGRRSLFSARDPRRADRGFRPSSITSRGPRQGPRHRHTSPPSHIDWAWLEPAAVSMRRETIWNSEYHPSQGPPDFLGGFFNRSPDPLRWWVCPPVC